MARGDRISFRGGTQIDAPLLLAIVAIGFILWRPRSDRAATQHEATPPAA